MYGGGGEISAYTAGTSPCFGDPIVGVYVASSGASGIQGGMFGCVRNGILHCPDKKWHNGMDIKCDPYTEVFTMRHGEVIRVVNTFEAGEYAADSYGNQVIIRTTNWDGSFTDIRYAHLNTVSVSEGDHVNAMTPLGLSGNTGNTADPMVPETHLHIEVENGGTAVNPSQYLATQVDSDGTVYSPCFPTGKK